MYEVVDGKGNVIAVFKEANEAAEEASDRQRTDEPNARVRHGKPNQQEQQG